MIIFFIICGHQQAARKRGPFVQLVVPNGLQLQIMQAAHDDVLAGHLGVAKTYEVVRQRFYWLKMFQDIQHYCRSCRLSFC